MKNASTSLNITEQLDKYTLDQAFPDHSDGMWDQLQEVQSLSDSLDECGNIAQDALLSATTDYIKNTGIQEAGRELLGKLGAHNDTLDCISGFATLFDSKGIIDDAMGLGDLPQIMSRVQNVIKDATNPNRLANMVLNLDIVSGLLDDFNDMCTGMKDALNKLVAADLASLMAMLNKLAQWAAFAKIANSDPCALVNNNKMLSHITQPVMDDIVKLYNSVTGGTAGPDNPIINLGDFLDGGLPSLPTFTQAPGLGLDTFESYKTKIPSEVDSVSSSLTDDAFAELGLDLPPTSSDDDAYAELDLDPADVNVPMELVDGEWVDSGSLKEKSQFTQDLLSGNSPIDNSTDLFSKNKDKVEFDSIMKQNDSLIKGIEYDPDQMALDELAYDLEEGNIEAVSDFEKSVLAPTRSEAAAATLESAPEGSGKDTPSATPPTDMPKPHSISKTVNRTVGVQIPPVVIKAVSISEGYKAAVPVQDWDVTSADGSTVEDPWNNQQVADFKYSQSVDGQRTKALVFPTNVSSKAQDKPKTCGCIGARVKSRLDAGIDIGTSRAQQSKERLVSASCSSRGGTWKCSGIVPTNTQTLPAGGFNHAKNVELQTKLPSTKAFDTTKIGV